jgi:hypothetical protein
MPAPVAAVRLLRSGFGLSFSDKVLGLKQRKQKLPEEENKGKTASKGEKSKEAGGKDCKSIAELLA